MSWIDEHEHRMMQADEAAKPELGEYLREQSLSYHAQGLQAQCAIEKEAAYAAHRATEKIRQWVEANL